MKDLIEMVREVQRRSSKRNLTRTQIAEALRCYAEAVSFCDVHALPYDAIRVQMCGGYGFARNFDAQATFLEFDGRSWSARRARVGGRSSKRQMKCSLRAWIEADEEHREKVLLLGGRIKKEQSYWELDLPIVK
jgi:hypothetical protein